MTDRNLPKRILTSPHKILGYVYGLDEKKLELFVTLTSVVCVITAPNKYVFMSLIWKEDTFQLYTSLNFLKSDEKFHFDAKVVIFLRQRFEIRPSVLPQTITVAVVLRLLATMFFATHVQLAVSERRACLIIRL